METVLGLFDFVMHLDKHMGELIQNYGGWTYFILFAIIFCETGLVVMPFLPGDSLIFVVGALAAGGALDVGIVTLLLMVAASTGNTANYFIGRFLAPKVFGKEKMRFINHNHIERTRRFYERHGGKTILVARFLPIIRTVAPFVAGASRMEYHKFQLYNILGSIVWVGTFILAGYFFGRIPAVADNFTLVIAVITLTSLLPAVVGFLGVRIKKDKKVGQ